MQGGTREATEIFNELIRGSVRQAFWQMMAEEVELLCGPPYQPDENSEHRRAGSEKGSVYLAGAKEQILRSRVRHRSEGEVTLESYRAASSQEGLFEQIVGLVGEGMSQRGLARATQNTISKSAVSRMWEDKSREQLAQLRERALDQSQWLAIMIDGVFLGSQGCVVIALGIDTSGRKQVLDFEAGDSESQETVSRLIGRLQKRGVRARARAPAGSGLLVVRDGSKAIASAVSRCWPEACQQAGLVHVELRSKKELIEKFIEEQLPQAGNATEIPECFEEFWEQERVKAFEQLCKEEQLNADKLQKVIDRYVYTGEKPLPDPDIVELINRPLKLAERGLTRVRVLDKVVHFVETFVHGLAA